MSIRRLFVICASDLRCVYQHKTVQIMIAEISSAIRLNLQREWIHQMNSRMWMIPMRRTTNHHPRDLPMQDNLSVFSLLHNITLTIRLTQQPLPVRLIVDTTKYVTTCVGCSSVYNRIIYFGKRI